MLHGIVGQVCQLLFPTFLYDTAINLLCAKLRAKKKKNVGGGGGGLWRETNGKNQKGKSWILQWTQSDEQLTLTTFTLSSLSLFCVEQYFL